MKKTASTVTCIVNTLFVLFVGVFDSDSFTSFESDVVDSEASVDSGASADSGASVDSGDCVTDAVDVSFVSGNGRSKSLNVSL